MVSTVAASPSVTIPLLQGFVDSNVQAVNVLRDINSVESQNAPLITPHLKSCMRQVGFNALCFPPLGVVAGILGIVGNVVGDAVLDNKTFSANEAKGQMLGASTIGSALGGAQLIFYGSCIGLCLATLKVARLCQRSQRQTPSALNAAIAPDSPMSIESQSTVVNTTVPTSSRGASSSLAIEMQPITHLPAVTASSDQAETPDQQPVLSVQADGESAARPNNTMQALKCTANTVGFTVGGTVVGAMCGGMGGLMSVLSPMVAEAMTGINLSSAAEVIETPVEPTDSFANDYMLSHVVGGAVVGAVGLGVASLAIGILDAINDLKPGASASELVGQDQSTQPQVQA